jgi:hypothetical protein
MVKRASMDGRRNIPKLSATFEFPVGARSKTNLPAVKFRIGEEFGN